MLLSPLALTHIHSVLKSALEHAVREEEIPRNVARNVRTGTPRPRRFEPFTADEARQFLAATRGHQLHALFELALHTGLRKGEPSACAGRTSTSTPALPHYRGVLVHDSLSLYAGYAACTRALSL